MESDISSPPTVWYGARIITMPSVTARSIKKSAPSAYIGSSNNIAIGVAKLTNSNGFQINRFWLRSPYYYAYGNFALVAIPGDLVYDNKVSNSDISVVPAFDLNLSDASFASAAEAASSSYRGFKANDKDNIMTANTYTLRYESSGSEEAVISPDETEVQVTNANGKYLMVQNNNGVYVLAIDDGNTVYSNNHQICGCNGYYITGDR